MVDMKKITRGKQGLPFWGLIYSLPAVGKTTFASRAPKPFIIDADKGSHLLDVQGRVVPESWTEAKEWVTAVEKGAVDCDTLVLDSVTELEAMSHKELFSGEGIDKWDGGWGHGDTHALMAWRELMAQLERVRASGKGVILVAHATVRRFDDPAMPAGQGYDRYEIGARKSISGLLYRSMDYVLFARQEVVTTRADKRTNATTSIGDVRYIHTRRSPAFDAKARGTTLFPDKLILDWEVFNDAVRNDAANRDRMALEMEAMLAEIANKEYEKPVREYLKAYPQMIVDAHNRVAAKLDEVRKSKESV